MSAAQRLDRSRSLWRLAQRLGLVALVLLIVGLLLRPDAALALLWYLVIPLVPASLLVSPAIWRNVCPLATLNTLANGMGDRRKLMGGPARTSGLVGIMLLGVLVPARRLLFNTDGPALAVTIVLVGLLALALGAWFDLKAGFCNAICPVLPVERLYGQRPLVGIGNPRCITCTLCTQTGCIDLAPTKAIAQVLGPVRRSHTWIFTSFGAFAAAFPGFVVGYYTTQDGPMAAAGDVYLHVALWSAISYVLVASAVWGLKLTAPQVTPWLAAAAITLYYWFASPLIASTLRLGETGALALRGAAILLVLVWLSPGAARNRPAGP